MRFGMCVGSDFGKIKLVAESGFDYVESCFSLLAESDCEQFGLFKSELEKYSLKCETVNCFLPGNLKVTGPQVDYDALREYIEKVCHAANSWVLKKWFSVPPAQEMFPPDGAMRKHTGKLSFF